MNILASIGDMRIVDFVFIIFIVLALGLLCFSVLRKRKNSEANLRAATQGNAVEDANTGDLKPHGSHTTETRADDTTTGRGNTV